jgi:hypothetical protein
MKKLVPAAVLVCAMATASLARADESIEYLEAPASYPFQRSEPAGQAIAIAPYDRLFEVRVFTTPQRQPYYNVPPYPVLAPLE